MTLKSTCTKPIYVTRFITNAYITIVKRWANPKTEKYFCSSKNQRSYSIFPYTPTTAKSGMNSNGNHRLSSTKSLLPAAKNNIAKWKSSSRKWPTSTANRGLPIYTPWFNIFLEKMDKVASTTWSKNYISAKIIILSNLRNLIAGIQRERSTSIRSQSLRILWIK